jgi:hypothetical protein
VDDASEEVETFSRVYLPDYGVPPKFPRIIGSEKKDLRSLRNIGLWAKVLAAKGLGREVCAQLYPVQQSARDFWIHAPVRDSVNHKLKRGHASAGRPQCADYVVTFQRTAVIVMVMAMHGVPQRRRLAAKAVGLHVDASTKRHVSRVASALFPGQYPKIIYFRFVFL